MEMPLIAGLIVGTCTAAGALAAWVWRRTAVQRTRRQVSAALAAAHEIFAAIEKIPPSLISRELRRGLVLLAKHHIDKVQRLQPRHFYLSQLNRQLALLNRIPSGMQRDPLRSRQARRDASLALEQMAEALKKASTKGCISQRQATLAGAAAQFAAQQVAVETARQAAKDAENVKAYRQALNFAYQAQDLCRRLPPLMGKALNEAVQQDVHRLERTLGKVAEAS